MTNSSILYSAAQCLTDVLGMSRDGKRNAENVALRAGYFVQCVKLNIFTLTEIGASVSYVKNGKTHVYNHATVIHLNKKASWGTFDKIPSFKESMEFFERFFKENLIDRLESQIEIIDKAPDSSTQVLNEQIATLYRKVHSLETANKILKEDNDQLRSRLNKIGRTDFRSLYHRASKVNSAGVALGYESIDLSSIDRIKELSVL